MKNRLRSLTIPALTHALLGLSLGALALPACSGPTVRTSTTPKAKAKAKAKITNLRNAALPFKVLVARGGREISKSALFAKLANVQAICIGESHPDPHHHWAQWQLFKALSTQNSKSGVKTALGMEMFQRPYQGILDDYRGAKISQREMLSRTAWKKRWGYPYGLYKPMIRLAVKNGHALLALNTSRELIKKVSRRGLDIMDPEDKAKLPELNLTDKQHRAWWRKLMGGMGGGAGHSSPHGHSKHGKKKKKKPHPSKMSLSERIYSAQVTWDETMAETASKWLLKGERRQIIILAGNGHCHETAIVRRMRRRGIKHVVSIHPIVDTGDGEVGELLAAPVNDYVFVMTSDKQDGEESGR